MRLLLLACTAAMLIMEPAAAQDPSPVAAPRTRLVEPEVALQGFDAFVRKTMQEWKVPGAAISIVKDGEIVLSKGYGVRDPVSKAPMTKDTLFLIASMAKTFTSFGAGLLVDEGKLDLDKSVRAYVPEFEVKDVVGTSEISLRDLLSHRSGITDLGWWYDLNLTRNDVIERLPHLELTTPIRTKMDYSNFGYSVAGHAVERVAGMSWEGFTQTHILDPLEMTRSTTQRKNLAEKDPNHINGVIWWKGRYVPTELQIMPLSTAPAGGIYSTADDLANWMIVHLSDGKFRGKQIIQPDTLKELHATAVPASWEVDRDVDEVGYGLGWFTQFHRGEPFITHGGNHWGVSTELGLLPQQGLGITVLVNQDSSRYPTALMRTLLDRFMGAQPRDWSSEMWTEHQKRLEAKDGNPGRQAAERTLGTKPSRPLSAYVGTYSHPGMGSVKVTAEGGQLYIEGAGEKAPLKHWQYDIFAADAADHMGMWAPAGWMVRVGFVTDLWGKISELRLTNAIGYSFKKEVL